MEVRYVPNHSLEETEVLNPFVKFGFCTNRGIRIENQDSYLIHINQNVASFAVADGAGGHQFGKQASKLTVDAIKRELDSNTDNSPAYVSLLMKKKYEQINSYVYEEGKKRNAVMATTLALLHIFSGKIIISNVGDTKILRIRDKKISCVSEIHTVAWMEFMENKINAEELDNHKFKHVLTRAIGARDQIIPFMQTKKALPKDIYIICTDGLYNFISEDTLLDIFTNTTDDFNELCYQSVQKALKNNSNDNVTLIAVQVM